MRAQRAARRRAAARRSAAAEARAAAIERQYPRAPLESAPPERRSQRSRARVTPADDDALRIGGALALLAVAASSALLAAQAARLRRELRS